MDAAGSFMVGGKRRVATWSPASGLKMKKAVVWPGMTTVAPSDPIQVFTIGVFQLNYLPPEYEAAMRAAAAVVNNRTDILPNAVIHCKMPHPRPLSVGSGVAGFAGECTEIRQHE